MIVGYAMVLSSHSQRPPYTKSPYYLQESIARPAFKGEVGGLNPAPTVQNLDPQNTFYNLLQWELILTPK